MMEKRKVYNQRYNKKNKEKRKIYNDLYYKKNKNLILQRAKEYYKKPENKEKLKKRLIENKIKRKEYNSEWYKKNRVSHIKKIKNNQKDKKYNHEKTPKQKIIRYIKRRTRIKYPFKNHKCEFCSNLATEHHHNTIPIEVHSFNYVCHECHMKINKKEVLKQWI